MEMPLISVIVPVYKVEQYLDCCVRSIVEQTYSNLEIILVDDGSPDDCPAMCDAWAGKDSRIKVIHKENGGLSDARNAGLAVAAGDFISFIDSDDWVTPEFLEVLYGALTERKADVAECGVSYMSEAGAVLRQRGAAQQPVMDRTEALRRLVTEDGIYQTVWNKLYRRDVIKGILFEKEKYHEDDFWTYQVFDRIERLTTVNGSMYHYLQREGSIMGNGYTLKRLDSLEARFLRMQYLQKYGELAALTRQMLLLDCMWHYQSAKQLLTGQDREKALRYIKKVMKHCPSVPASALTGKMTHRAWYVLFKMMPNLTVWMRKKLGIGA